MEHEKKKWMIVFDKLLESFLLFFLSTIQFLYIAFKALLFLAAWVTN